jgi:hypothetical protein
MPLNKTTLNTELNDSYTAEDKYTKFNQNLKGRQEEETN